MTATVRDGLLEHIDALVLKHYENSGTHIDEGETDSALVPTRQIDDVLYFTRLLNPRYAATTDDLLDLLERRHDHSALQRFRTLRAEGLSPQEVLDRPLAADGRHREAEQQVEGARLQRLRDRRPRGQRDIW